MHQVPALRLQLHLLGEGPAAGLAGRARGGGDEVPGAVALLFLWLCSGFLSSLFRLGFVGFLTFSHRPPARQALPPHSSPPGYLLRHEVRCVTRTRRRRLNKAYSRLARLLFLLFFSRIVVSLRQAACPAR